ncbi:sphingomyelin synthase-related protein 1-like [Glandiceps talaboti]
MSIMVCDAHDWTTQQVAKWLDENGFHSYINTLCSQHKIDGEVLMSLTEDDLRKPPIELKVLGDIKKLSTAIKRLHKDSRNSKRLTSNQATNQRDTRARRRSELRHHVERLDSTESIDYASSENEFHFYNHSPYRRERNKHKFKVERKKTVISFVYFVSALLLTSFVMTVVHDRVPDMDKYPPLPDIVLDNLPHIPWAFKVCEAVGIILGTILTIVLVLHKHRLIILRRLFSLTGTIFLLRCATMFMTSLSVPGVHLQCSGKIYDDLWSKLIRTLEICIGMGMSLTGVNTCGDYMFSGHTVVVTTLNFFITEYTPRNYNLLHTASWVMNIFGIFFILAAHEHYSIDVFVAFYITSRLFLYYHSLANNRALHHGDKRTRVWFPLFTFFECNVDGTIPWECEWPFSQPVWLKQLLES